ncbi:MAG: Dabb family protein [Porphyromonas sp.]|nr:Dabb family protein [Porphyromonas sp.]
MLKHIVLFTLGDFASGEAKCEQLALIKRELEALPALIPALHSLEVHYNENPAESYDFGLVAVVDSLATLPEYADHPEHVRVAREFIKPYLKARACIDYTEPTA